MRVTPNIRDGSKQELMPWSPDPLARSLAHVRNWSGEAVEEWVHSWTGGRRTVPTPGHICPDIMTDFSGPIEVKSAQHKREVLLFSEQFDPYLETAGFRTVIVFHSATKLVGLRRSSVRSRTLAAIEESWLLTAKDVRNLAMRPSFRRLLPKCKGAEPTEVFRVPYRNFAKLKRGYSFRRYRVGNWGQFVWSRHDPVLPGLLAEYSKPVRDAASELLAEMDEGWLDVGLAPAPDPKHECHMIRVVNGQNAPWYQALCARHPDPYGRRGTEIRRHDVEKALRAIISGHWSGGIMEDRLRPFIEEYAERHEIAPDDEVPF